MKDMRTYSASSSRPLHGSRLPGVKLSRPISKGCTLGCDTSREQASPEGESGADEVHFDCNALWMIEDTAFATTMTKRASTCSANSISASGKCSWNRRI